METVSSFDGARWLTVAMGREGTGRWSGFRSDICPDSGLEMSLISVAVRAAGEDIQALVRRRHVHAAGTNASGAVVLTLLANRAVSDALRSSKPVGGLLGWRATFEPARWWRPTSVEWIALASSCRFDAVATGARSLDLDGRPCVIVREETWGEWTELGGVPFAQRYTLRDWGVAGMVENVLDGVVSSTMVGEARLVGDWMVPADLGAQGMIFDKDRGGDRVVDYRAPGERAHGRTESCYGVASLHADDRDNGVWQIDARLIVAAVAGAALGLAASRRWMRGRPE